MERQPLQAQLLPAAATPCSRLCGLDEVGRGALAGPLVAAAVILPDDFEARLGHHARFLRDSKTVPPHHRATLAELIHTHALAIEMIEIPVASINADGIGWANREAFFRLIERIEADEYVVDGRVRPHAPAGRAARVHCMVKADAHIPAVSAASIVAKVHRDNLMAALHATYPEYGWHENAGYGTAAHVTALHTHGSCAMHRIAFVETVFAGGQRARRTQRIGAENMLPLMRDARAESID